MEPSPTPYDSPETGRPRLLIADDDAVVRSALAQQLAGHFELVATARDAAEAVELAAETRPDLAIVDVEMPAGGGPHAARGIADCSPSTAIVALSIDESRDVVLEMLGAGAVTYVRKGIRSPDLIDTLLHCVAHAPTLTAGGSSAASTGAAVDG
jgi:DNA-binding NarL/FixJ family response regulator